MTDPPAARRRALDTGLPVVVRTLEEQDVAGWSAAAAGPLAGLPFAVKDNIDIAGYATTAGCPARTEPATSSAVAVQRLMAAGAVPVAKTNLDQYATGLVGTRSPYGACHSVDSDVHVSGGSSSGSALAVALGIVPLALGTDTAGSGRVPAAFNGLVGVKPTKGLVSTRGVLPACRSLDCVTTLTRTVAEGAAALQVMAGYDAADPWSRRAPVVASPSIAERMRVVAVPDAPPDLDDAHRAAWLRALERLAAVPGVGSIVPVAIEPLLAAARLLYEGPWLAERVAAFGAELDPDGPHLDPVVRRIVLAGRGLLAEDAFRGMDRLAELRRAAEPMWTNVDVLMLPVTPTHPTLAEVAADPVGVNARLGTYTNMTNLLDLCAVAVPAGRRDDGLPFGVQFLAPAFADRPLLDLAARWCGEDVPSSAVAADRSLVAVCGAHMSGEPLNAQLVTIGGRLHARGRTVAGYRLYALPGTPARPALVFTGDGPAGGVELEVWSLPRSSVGTLLAAIPAPLGLGTVRLDDGSAVTGFLSEPYGLTAEQDITSFGGWRGWLGRG
jgi:allophanate hydrolase